MGMVRLKDLGGIGYAPDQEGYELPPNALTLASNIRMRGGWAERVGGYEQVLTDTAVVPYGLFAHSSSDKDYLVTTGLAATYVDDGSTRTDISGSAWTGAADNKFTGGTLNGLLVLNNGVDVPKYWDNNTANNLAALTAWPSGWLASSLRPFKNFLMALNVTKSSTAYPQLVAWSDSADPGAIPAEWAASATNNAGEVSLAETPDAIVDGMPLGDFFVVYKERSKFAMQYVGGNEIFRVWRMPGESGLLARNCVATTPLGHVCLTQGDVVLHNGQGDKSIVDSRARRWLFDSISTTNYQRSFLVVNQGKQEVWICFPEAGQAWCTKALVWCWSNDTLSTRELPTITSACNAILTEGATTWSNVTGTWSSIIGGWSAYNTLEPVESFLFMAALAQKIHRADVGYSANGSSFTATAERKGLSLDDPQQIKLCKGVWPKIDGSTGTQVTVQIGASMDAETEPTWSTAQTFTLGTSQKVDSFATGRYLSYRVTSTGTQAWRFRSMDLDVVPAGRF
jgi:hypothetical protein